MKFLFILSTFYCIISCTSEWLVYSALIGMFSFTIDCLPMKTIKNKAKVARVSIEIHNDQFDFDSVPNALLSRAKINVNCPKVSTAMQYAIMNNKLKVMDVLLEQ